MLTSNQRVLVTGGGGLIGSHIVDLLAADEELNPREIVVLDDFTRGRIENLSNSLDKGSVTVVKGDIRDRDLLTKLMKEIDVVFHLAAIRITHCAEDPRLALEVLVKGAFNIYEAAVNAGVKKLITSSTASVYGLADTFPTPETQHPYHNRTFYGAAKAFNEGMLRSFNDMYGLDYLALRYFNVYGPRMDVYGKYTEVMIRWMERIDAGLPPLIFGDGNQTLDLVYVEDVARANIVAAKSALSDDVFNIASGEEVSLKEMAYALLDVMGSELEPEYGPERKVNPVSRRLADTSKAKELLDYETRVGMKEGLSRLVAWWRAEKDAGVLRAA
jgi:UDP-glucose 4-epimerase